MTPTAEIQPSQRVTVRHAGRLIHGHVTSTAYRGTTLLGIGFWAPELGSNRIDDSVTVVPADIVGPDQRS
jgi:hypothetical protein